MADVLANAAATPDPGTSTFSGGPPGLPAPIVSAPPAEMQSDAEAHSFGSPTGETTLGESMEAAFSGAPTPSLSAAAEASRYFADTGSFDYTNMGGGAGYWPPDIPGPYASTPTTQDVNGIPMMRITPGAAGPPGQHITAEEADAQAKEAGATLKPFAPGTMIGPNELQGMIRDSVAANKNADIVNRSASGIIATPARVAAGMLGSMVDPANQMTLMVPGAPEAWAARGIESLGGGLAARAAVHGAAGALQGAAMGAATVPLQAAVASEDQQDFSWSQAFQDTMMQAVIGAGAGALHGMISRGDPDIANATMKAALARTVEDHPEGVDIEGLIDHSDATQAAANLEQFQKLQGRVDADRADLAAPEPDTAPVDRGQEIAAHTQRLQDLREQAQTFFREAEGVREERIGADTQDAQFGRIDAINTRLAEGIPLLERQQLETEKAQIEAGGTDQANLERERSIAQEAGLRSASANAAARARETEGMIERLHAQDAEAMAEAEANRTSADRATRIKQLRLDSREEVLQSLMEQQVRRYAAKMGVALEPGEAQTAAREIRTAGSGDQADVIAAHLNAIAKRSDAFPVRDALAAPRQPVVQTPSMLKLRQEAAGAATDMAKRIQNPTNPELTQAQETQAQTAARTPKLEGDVSKITAETQQAAADRKAEYDALVKSGQAPELPSLEKAGNDYEEFAKGIEAYAKTCGFGE